MRLRAFSIFGSCNDLISLADKRESGHQLRPSHLRDCFAQHHFKCLIMWLLDVEKLQLLSVPDPSKRKYAILSHTWDDVETSFQDIQDTDRARSKPSFQKITKTCDIARSKKLRYAWIDTYCIDKTSSAELSEAINSMFEWYKQSQVCYVYLSDFEPLPTPLKEKARRVLVANQLRKCRWFTRGWTLQELVAPRKLEFFDRDWNFICGRESLQQTLLEITGIDGDVLHDNSKLASIPIGRRMSWAVGRKTTRVEDIAYSLLGIFNINMPLLYGEGARAFFRLQQEIARQSNDLTLFAWQYTPCEGEEPPVFSGVFAESPDAFWPCSTLRRHDDYFTWKQEFSITNTGLRIDGSVLSTDKSSEVQFLMGLDCIRMINNDDDTSKARLFREGLRTVTDEGCGPPRWVAIRLRKVGNSFVRYMPATIATARSRSEWTSVKSDDVIGGPLVYNPVYLQTLMRFDEVLRVRSLIDTGVVLIYDEFFEEHMTHQCGLPREPEVNNDSGPGGRQVFTFPSNLEDNFVCAHIFQLGRDSFIVVCKLQWMGARCDLRMGLFDVERILSGFQTELDTDIKRRDALEEIKDEMLVRFSDLTGRLDQRKMPITAMGPSVLWSSDSSNDSDLMLRRLEINPLGTTFTLKENYYHVEVARSFRNAVIPQEPGPDEHGLSRR